MNVQRTHNRSLVLLAAGLSLAIIAVSVPTWRMPDSYWYTDLAEKIVIPGCSSIACFRVLVAWTMALIPGVELKWRIYSVIFNALAGLAVFDLSLSIGLSRRAATIAAALSVFGSQALWTVFEPFNSDPLMFFLGPLLTRWLLEERLARVGAVSAIGVLAKEFALAPLVIYTTSAALARRWSITVRAGAVMLAGLSVWLILQVWLMRASGYNYGNNASTRLFAGGYLWFWLTHQPLSASLAAQFVEFGAVYLVLPIGFRQAPRRLKELTLAALPAVAVFCYVEQPDRALWNFHFLITPLAALALERQSNSAIAAFVALYALANLRVGAQLTFVPSARYALAASTVMAAAIVVAEWRARWRHDAAVSMSRGVVS